MRSPTWKKCAETLSAVLAAMIVAGAAVLCAQNQSPQAAPSQSILDYIKQTWGVLTRSNRDLAKAAVDPKFQPLPDGRWPVYIPHTDDVRAVENALHQEMQASDYGKIEIRQLPENLSSLREQGLLYLPKPYVVPGGRFNEMYGWDSYFIQVGLLRDGELKLAKDMADNFRYEVRNYGKVLNANRTYYLSRSQPPFLTQMVLGVYQKTQDRKWLEDSLPLIQRYYEFFTTEPHLTPETGLSRYFDLGEGPAPEVVSAERDAAGRTHYDLVKEYFRTHEITDYDVSQYYDRKTNELTMLFYKGDRSMRESGFDPSNRFGAFNIDIIHYDPVCLNSLLYVMETQTGEILSKLGRDGEVEAWRKRAEARAEKMNRLMWDEKEGLYYDYDFVHHRVRHYPFLTTFYPLWAGLASKEQAARVQQNLSLFEKAGGLQTSTYVSGNQWDSPFGWAPLQMIAVEGLRRYGYPDDAERISMKFLSLVRREFERQGYIVEKYDVVQGGSNVAAKIHFGYSANQAGFGWTNAVFTELYDQLTPEDKRKVMGE
ncbi:MAG: trehalase [Acidobacteriaceae bacterium]|nr:trehalase [Acidobacteriaceae bacterium]MBV9778733.1 trehalase [Acidobacteriaceae bacterium]